MTAHSVSLESERIATVSPPAKFSTTGPSENSERRDTLTLRPEKTSSARPCSSSHNDSFDDVASFVLPLRCLQSPKSIRATECFWFSRVSHVIPREGRPRGREIL